MRNDMLLAELSHFIDLINGAEHPISSLSDGILAMNLALAAKKSSSEKKISRVSQDDGKIMD